MIIIAGRLYVAPEQREGYLAATADVAVKARQFPGCLDFVQTADPVEPGRINIYEQWQSDQDLLAFRASGDPLPPLPKVQKADVKKYRIAAVEPP